MQKNSWICCATILGLCFMTSIGVGAMAPAVEQLVREGVGLHNVGEYQAAIDTYLQALKLEPHDPMIYYELGYSYMANKQYDQCISVTQQGLTLQPTGSLESGLYVLEGSCYSSQDKTAEALAVFRAGLAKYPYDTGLNYNIAITLTKTQRIPEAVAHAKAALIETPTYASPYFLLAQLHEQQGELIPSLVFYLRFAMLEPNSSRTQYAAYKAYVLANVGIVVEEEGQFRIKVDLEQEHSADIPAALDLGLKLAMMNQRLDETKDPATQFVQGMSSFLQICSELKGEEFRTSFTWQWAIAQLVILHEQGYSDAFFYYLAAFGNIGGAVEWLQAHPDSVKELPKYLQ